MSDYQNYYESCKLGTWQDKDPKLCGCGGCGWFLSDLDIEFQCYYHYDGQPCREGSEEDWKEYEAKKAGLDSKPQVTQDIPLEVPELDDLPF